MSKIVHQKHVYINQIKSEEADSDCWHCWVKFSNAIPLVSWKQVSANNFNCAIFYVLQKHLQIRKYIYFLEYFLNWVYKM